MSETLQSPVIHINGSSGEVLFNQVCEAGGALRAALLAMEATAPNGRDYYPQGPKAFKAACVQHNARTERVRSVYLEYQALAELIRDSIDEREQK